MSQADGPATPADGADRWLAQSRHDERIAERGREASLRRQATLDVSLAGVAVDLAERGAPVLLATADGAGVRVVLHQVGVDHLLAAVVGPGPGGPGGVLVVPWAAVAALQPVPDAGRAGGVPGDRRPASTRSLAVLLAELAEARAAVRVALRHGDRLDGRLVAAGADVLGVQTATAAASPAWVALGAVAWIGLDEGPPAQSR